MSRRQHSLPDRHSDPRPSHPITAARPALLSRGKLRWLCVASLAVIVYGTLGPLGLRGHAWLDFSRPWSFVLTWERSDWNDWVTNLLVYLPVGFALRLLVRRRGFAGMADFVVACIGAAALSYITEVLQQFMPARSSNLQDVLANSLAGMVGAALAPMLQLSARRVHAHTYEQWQSNPWSVASGLWILLTIGLMILPIKLAHPIIETSLDRGLDLDDVRRFSVFVVMGGLMTVARWRGVGDCLASLPPVIMRILGFAVGLELLQVFSSEHACGLLDMLVAAMGGLFGCGGALILIERGAFGAPGKRPSGPPPGLVQRAIYLVVTAFADIARIVSWIGSPGRGDQRSTVTRQLIGVSVIATSIFAFAAGISRHEPDALTAHGPQVRLVPFQVHFMKPFPQALSMIVEDLVTYGMLAALCLYLTRGASRGVVLMLLVGIVGVTESYRAATGRGAADITSLLIAVVAWLVTTRAWDLLQPRRRPVSTDSPSLQTT